MSRLSRIQPFAGICLGLALVTTALYWPMLHHDFISYYDDDSYITGNSHVNRGLTWAGVVWAFQSGYAANWHPLTWISHMLDCQIYGLNPWGHHLTNLLFHVANTLLLFLWLKQLTGALWRSGLVAALFAWHPLHIESVAWAAERKDVLSAFFWMLTLIAYTRYARSVASGGWRVAGAATTSSPVTRHPSLFYGLALLGFACGLMSKAMVVTLPFVLLLIDFWPLKRFSCFAVHVSGSETASTPDSSSTQSIARLILEKLPFFALALGGSAITYSIQHSGGAVWSPDVLTFHLRLANALMAYARYISKAFWPSDLALIYPYPHHWPTGLVLVTALTLAVWSGLFVWRARQNPCFFVGWFWFLGTLVPTIGVVQVGVQSMADRYMYLPSIGLFILVAWGLNDWVNFRPAWQKPVIVFCGTALAGCLAGTEIQLCYWQNSLTVFFHTINVTTDNYAAYNCLGNALEKAGQKEAAMRLYAESVRIQPDYPLGQFNLGMMLLEDRRPAEASNHLAIAAQLMPQNPDVQYDLGVFLLQHDRPEEAIRHFETALGERPDFPEARTALDQARVKLKTIAPVPANRSTP